MLTLPLHWLFGHALMFWEPWSLTLVEESMNGLVRMYGEDKGFVL